MLSIDCWYIKGNSHTICLCMINSLPRRMPNSIRMQHTFCLTSRPHASFVFAFRCKPGLRCSIKISSSTDHILCVLLMFKHRIAIINTVLQKNTSSILSCGFYVQKEKLVMGKVSILFSGINIYIHTNNYTQL